MPSSFVEQRPSAASSEDTKNRIFEDLLHRLQQQNTQLQPFASVSISSMPRDSLETIKRESNIDLHNRAANSIFNAREATNTTTIEQCQQPAAASAGILRVPCRARRMPKDHAIFKVSHLRCMFCAEMGLLCFFFPTFKCNIIMHLTRSSSFYSLFSPDCSLTNSRFSQAWRRTLVHAFFLSSLGCQILLLFLLPRAGSQA